MSNANKKNRDFSFEIVKVLREERIDEHNRFVLWVVKWSRSPKPVLEKRRIWKTKEGVDRPFKTVGLNAGDLRFIFDHYPEIINLL